ncbi:MAG: TRAP transporter small permease subunit [Treponema sp.]|nr:TRAP transporter small permease subunit [Treponema sp.]
MGVLRRTYRFLCKAETVICCIGFMFLIAFVFLSAILRFFRVSLSWNIDLAMLLLAWTAFLGADIAWRSGQFTGVDLVTRNLPPVLQKIIQIIVYLIITAALLVIFVYGMRLVWIERVRTYQSMPIPYSLVTLSLAMAAASMVCSTVIKIRRCIMDFGKKE